MLIKKLIFRLGKGLFILKNRRILRNPRRILIIRSGSIGDVIMTTPLLRMIRQKYKKAYITYMTGNWSKEVLKNNKNIDEVISYDDRIIFNYYLNEINKLRQIIKDKRFEMCLILDKSYQWNLFAYLCRIPFRLGFDRNGEGFCNNINVKFGGRKSELEYYLEIGKLIGGSDKYVKPELFLSKDDKKYSGDFVKKNKLKGRKMIGMAPGGAENPGTKMYSKRWPKESYTELIKRVINKNNAVLLFGRDDDYDLCEEIKDNNYKIINLAGKLTIQESASLIRKCKVFVTHDSGAMHIASTTNTKLIALFGPTDSKRFAPKDAVTIQSRLPCCPCYDIYGSYKKCKIDCMADIDVNSVYDKLKSII